MDFIKRLQQFLVSKRLKLALVIVLIYIVHKILDIQDKPFSFDNDLIGFIGFVVMLAGLFLRSWAAGIIMKNRQLITTGPYSLWRHPLYIGSFFLAIGFCIYLNDWFLWIVVLLLAFLIYLPKIKKEEKKLSELFPGEWEHYKKKTGIILWKKIDFREIFVRWSFRQWLYNKEYNPWIAVSVAIIVIEVWHIYY